MNSKRLRHAVVSIQGVQHRFFSGHFVFRFCEVIILISFVGAICDCLVHDVETMYGLFKLPTSSGSLSHDTELLKSESLIANYYTVCKL